MNWVQEELAAVAAMEPDLDAWLLCYPSWLYGRGAAAGECDHRWFYRTDTRPVSERGFFRLPVRTFCRKCMAEA